MKEVQHLQYPSERTVENQHHFFYSFGACIEIWIHHSHSNLYELLKGEMQDIA